MAHMKKNGFTLIELVVVIVILGILAVVAAPKFMNLQNDARNASLEGLEGALKSTFGMTYSKLVTMGLENQPYVSTADKINTTDVGIFSVKLPIPGCSNKQTHKCIFVYGYPQTDRWTLSHMINNFNQDWAIVYVPKEKNIALHLKNLLKMSKITHELIVS